MFGDRVICGRQLRDAPRDAPLPRGTQQDVRQRSPLRRSTRDSVVQGPAQPRFRARDCRRQAVRVHGLHGDAEPGGPGAQHRGRTGQ
jgi:hypothetical protein